MGPGGIELLLIYTILLLKYNPCAHNLSHKLLRFYLHSQSIMLWTQKFLMCNIFLCPIKEWSWWWASSVAPCADRWTMWWQNHCPGFTFSLFLFRFIFSSSDHSVNHLWVNGLAGVPCTWDCDHFAGRRSQLLSPWWRTAPWVSGGFPSHHRWEIIGLSSGKLAQDDVPAGGYIFLSGLHSEEKLFGDLRQRSNGRFSLPAQGRVGGNPREELA